MLFRSTPEAERYWDFVRLAMMSSANTCITPLQDFLGLDKEARINKPSTLGGNWEWRMDPAMLSDAMADKIYQITRISSRLPKAEVIRLAEQIRLKEEQEKRLKATREAKEKAEAGTAKAKEKAEKAEAEAAKAEEKVEAGTAKAEEKAEAGTAKEKEKA